MSTRQLSRLAVLAFVALGCLAATARYQSRERAHIARADSRWRLTYDIAFKTDLDVENQTSKATVSLGRPLATPFAEVVQENVVNLDSSLHVESREGYQRDFRISTLHTDTYHVTAEFDLRLHSDQMWNQYAALESLSAIRRRRYTQGDDSFPTQSPRIGEVLQQVPDDRITVGEKLQWIFDYCLRDLRNASKKDEGDNVPWALAFKRTTALGRAKVFVTLCRAMDVPARLVTGFELRHAEHPQPHVWTEVHRDNRWIPFDPAHGYARDMPHWFVPVRRGDDKIIRLKNAALVSAQYSMLRLPPQMEVLQQEMKRPSQMFDLTRLPLEMHALLSLMLLLPWGALITAVFRNIIGLRTLGTFAPALLAMSFIYAAWGTGLVVLLVVVIAGLVGRSLLERLHLLMVPRLSIVLTLIILCVAFGVSLLNYLSPQQSPQAVLLPLVILTILIERFFVTSEEDSTGYALQLVLGTVVVAAFCYVLLRWDDVGKLVLIYPEVHFFTIAVFILIGRYSGYRLTELWRFRDLAQERGPDQG